MKEINNLQQERPGNYEPGLYWQERLTRDFSLSGTGHSGFSGYYNKYMYRLKERALDKALKNYSIKVDGESVLDIGSGTGFFVDYYLKRKAANVVGIDITDISVNSLSRAFPSQRFYKADISAGPLPVSEKFDIINIFDVLYHITDEALFEKAVRNTVFCAKAGASILITDSLKPGRTAPHVRYRGIKEYEKTLGDNAVKINAVMPVLHLMSRSPEIRSGSLLIRRACAKIIDSLAPVYYFLDRIYCPKESSAISLLICQKQ